MSDFATTRLWKQAFEPRDADDDGSARERLRAVLLSMRESASLLAGEISRVLPRFTVHDITHLDALWELADLLLTEDQDLNPAETFVYGAAVLLHDLGLGLAAYPGGADEVEADVRYTDRIASLLAAETGAYPNIEQIRAAPVHISEAAFDWVVVQFHAERAETLATRALRDGDTERWLIESADLRASYGPLIGRIAHSHWWPLEQLTAEFDSMLGAPVWGPTTWTVDGLKVAALLRTTDALHIDSRRAPPLLRTLRQSTGVSQTHWQFQEKLQKPQVIDHRVVFTSGAPFTKDETAAWWMCHDSLCHVDRWLSQTASLLIDAGRDAFIATGVAGVDTPSRLARHIPTTGWLPVDASLKVTDVAGLVEKLGGTDLYGRDATIPIRELIQNAADAVRARRALENRRDDWGDVTVRTGSSDGLRWIEVEDDGVGMSETTLTRDLLDFGTSFWGSERATLELPGLLAHGYVPTGRYGLGFFSVFMLGSRVTVTSRFFRAAQSEARVLEFTGGLATRPIVRPATDTERLLDGGTRIRVYLHESVLSFYDAPLGNDDVATLANLVSSIAPAATVSITADAGGVAQQAVSANDWVTLGPHALIERCGNVRDEVPEGERAAKVAGNLRVIAAPDGSPLGRAAITVPDAPLLFPASGCIAVGGLRACGLHEVAGLMMGLPLRAARDLAVPLATQEEVARWASDQAELLAVGEWEPWQLMHCARVVHFFWGDTANLPVAMTVDGWISAPDIAAMNLPAECIVADARGDESYLRQQLDLDKSVFLTSFGWHSARDAGGPGSEFDWPAHPRVLTGNLNDFAYQSLHGVVIDAIARSWGLSGSDVWPSSQSFNSDNADKIEIGQGPDGATIFAESYSYVRRP